MEGGERSRDIYTSSTSSLYCLVASSLFLGLQISSHSKVSAQDGQIMCHVLPAKLHGSTSLTCHFPEDVSQTKKDFSVYRYTDKSSPDEVLDCWWMSDKLECRINQRYEYNKMISERLSLEILEVLAPQVYACQLPGYGPDSIHTCDLNIELDKTSSCHVASVKENEPTTFTCTFIVDLRVTRQDVKVIHQVNTGTDVVSCTWINEKPSCTTVPGFELNNTITDRLTIKVPRATLEYNGTYVCHLQGSQSKHFESCDFIVMTATNSPVGTIVAVTVGVIIVMVAVTLIIAFIIRKRRSRTRSVKKDLDEELPMIQTPPQEVDETTKNFLADLSNCFRKTYPEYDTKAYVVPSLYINNNTYEVQTFAGEEVYVTKPPDQQTVKHDLAMGRVLTSLHLLAKEGNEVMFVISQFDYDKYLANPRKEFTDHKLPRPGQLRKHDKHYGDFDILIIHRHHGLVVGVVKTCSGKSTQEVVETTKMVVEELKQGCTQLDEAEKMLQHLMSDLMSNPNQQMQFKKLLILPNLKEERLRIVLNENQNVAQIEKEYLAFPETTGSFYSFLYADTVCGLNRAQDIIDWFNRLFSNSPKKAFASDDNYAAIVARFCGPATIWSSNVLDPQSGILPKTLEDWVWMTGELFNKPRLQPQQWETLNTVSPLVFLSGPPASGKTRMLVLTGKRWMSEGHKVHVVSTGRKSRAANYMIYTELLTASKQKGISGSCELIAFETENAKERTNKLLKLAKNAPLYLITDEAYNAKKSSFTDFVGCLLKKVPGLHLWAASCLPDIAPQCCEVQVLTNSVTCPPSILLQGDVTKLAFDNAVARWRYDSKTTAPTDGPPVMVVNHDGKGHNGDYPHDCKTCAIKAIAHLQTLFCNISAGAKQKVEGQPRLYSKDILILCENEGETALCAALKNSEASVKIVDKMNFQQVFEANINEVWEAKGENMFGIKRKVVVYVEGNPKGKHKMSVDLIRLRGLTSSTSQLIWLRGRKKSETVSAAEVNLSN